MGMDYLMSSLEDHNPEKDEVAEVGVATKKKLGILWILRSQSVANGMYHWLPPSSSSPLPASSMSPRSHFECGGSESGSLVRSIGIASPSENSASNFKTMPSELLSSTTGLQSKEKQKQRFASPHLSSKLKSGKHILRHRYMQTYIKPGQLRREWVNNNLSSSMGKPHSQRKLCKALFQ